MKIRNKLYIGLMVSIALIASLVFVIFQTSDIITETNNNQASARAIEQATAELDILTFEYTEYHEKRMEEQWFARYNSLGDILRTTQASGEEKAMMDSMLVQYARIGDLFSNVTANYQKKQTLVQEGASKQQLDINDAQESRLVAQLLMNSQSMNSNAGIFARNEMAAELNADNLARNLTLSVTFVLLITAFIIAFVVTRTVTKPVSKLLEGTEIIGKGNLDHKIGINTKDEIGELSRAFNRMTTNLKDVTASKTELEKEITERMRAENALRESEERWATTLASIGDAVIATDIEGRISFMNAVAEQLTGWALNEASTKPVAEVFNIINEKSRAEVENPVTRVLKEGMIVGLANHTILVRKDGIEVPIDDSGAPIKDRDGKTVGVVLVFRDIAERKRAEEALRESEERFRLLYDLTMEGIVIHDKGIILESNDTLAKMFGYGSASLMVGMSGSDLMTPETRRLFMEHMKADSQEPYEGTGIKKDGTLFPIEIHASNIVYNGQRARAGTVYDLTERKQAEEHTRHLASFPQLNPNPILEVTSSGKITFFNPAAKKVLETLEMNKEDFTVFLPPDIEDILRDRDRKEGSSLYREIVLADRVFGESIYINPKLNVVRIYAYDITERKLVEKEQETAVEFLRLVNDSTVTADLIHSATTFFQQQSGCEAVGIRLKEGDDYPYYEARGFSKEFGRAENSLCVRDSRDNVLRDSKGFPINECMCGNVIHGRFDPSKPFFTARGSFWTNCTTELLATTTEADRQSRTRNRCNGEGYESVALIALHAGKEKLGLLQLNDRRKGLFSPEVIALWERLAGHLAIALAKFRAEEELRRSHGELEVRVQERTAELEEANKNIQEWATRLEEANIELEARMEEQQRAEEQIREQSELLDKANDAIGLRDLNHRLTYWNKGAERLYGWTVNEALGKNADKLIYKDESPKLVEAKKSVIENGEWTGELQQITKAGKEIIVESRWTLIRDRDGKPKSILIINTDITEKKMFESQLLRSQRMESIGTLAGGIAHDLNNMLTPIMISLQMLKQKFKDEQSQKLLTILENNSKRGANLIKQVLTFARGVEGERNPLQATHIITEIEKVAKETFPRNIEIRTDAKEDLYTISGDATQLHQVIMNLCVNARDAMPDGGILNITASNFFVDENYARMNSEAKIGSHVAIAVSDTGIGIPSEIQGRIFEPFFTTKELGKGTGLGLSTALAIVKSHGGFINVYSEVGKGTAFRVYLPAAETVPHNIEEEQPHLLTGHGEFVLIAEDEDSIREVTASTLEASGYKVITADEGAQAVALYAKNKDKIKGTCLAEA